MKELGGHTLNTDPKAGSSYLLGKILLQKKIAQQRTSGIVVQHCGEAEMVVTGSKQVVEGYNTAKRTINVVHTSRFRFTVQ